MSPVLMMLPPIDSTKTVEANELSLIKMCSWCEFYSGLGHKYKDCYVDGECIGLALFNQVRRLEKENKALRIQLEEIECLSNKKG